MMRKIKYTLLMALLAFSATWTSADLAAAGVAPEAEFKTLERAYRLLPDGGQEMRVKKVLTLYTHAAMNGLYGETFIQYNPDCQKVVINESYTRQKDGNIIKTPDNAFVTYLPKAAASAPAYNGLAEMVVVHTGLELGATIVLDYTVKTRPGYLKDLDVFHLVRELSPIREFKCTVEVPANRELHCTLLNSRTVPAVKTADGVKKMTLVLKNVKPRPFTYPVYDEYLSPLQQTASGMMPAIAATTSASFSQALEGLSEQFVPGDRTAVEKRAAALTEGLKDKKSKAAAIRKFMKPLYGKNGFCPLSLASTGYRIRPASQVLASSYGTRAELANLECALMQAAGVDAAVKVYALKSVAGKAGLSSILFIGTECAALAETSVKPEGTEGVLNALAGYLVISDIHGHELPAKPVEKLIVEKDVKAAAGEGTFKVTLLDRHPVIEKLFPYAANTFLPESILLPGRIDVTLNDRCTLEAGAKVILPKDRLKKCSAGTLSFSYRQNGGVVEVSRVLVIDRPIVTPSEYRQFYEMMAEWMDDNNRKIAVKK